MVNEVVNPAISMEDALKIARIDAEKAYRDISDLKVSLALHEDGWHIEFDLMSLSSHGGGPQYRIDPITGEILWKRYYQ